MKNNIIAFPRKRPLEWEEMPAYWDLVARRYYDMDIEDGMTHQEAFDKWDAWAKTLAAVPPQQPDESRLESLARRARAALAAAAST